MPSLAINPSIDQAALQNFNDSFFALAQQTKSKLMASGAIKFLPSKGKTNNMARIGRLELSEVNTRNPDKQYGDYALDNRQFSKRRFTKTIQIDAKYDINELIKDPSSDILTQLTNAKERVIDRIAIAAAVGPVLTGGPDVAPTAVTATQDGVQTISAVSGFVFATVQAVTQGFINNDIFDVAQKGTTIAITGKENTNLMGEEKFTSQFYIGGRPVEGGYMPNTGMYKIALFAGSVNGGAQVPNPILPEGTTTRSCVVLAPEAIAMAMELADLSVTKSAQKVNSWDLTIDFWINAMRTEGARVQIITTTL